MIKQKFKSSLDFHLGFDKVQYKLDHQQQQQVRVEILPIFHLYKFSPVCPFHVESKISNFCCKSVPGNNFPWIELYAKFNTLAPLWTSEVCTIIWSLNFKLIFQQCFKSAKKQGWCFTSVCKMAWIDRCCKFYLVDCVPECHKFAKTLIVLTPTLSKQNT